MQTHSTLSSGLVHSLHVYVTRLVTVPEPLRAALCAECLPVSRRPLCIPRRHGSSGFCARFERERFAGHNLHMPARLSSANDKPFQKNTCALVTKYASLDSTPTPVFASPAKLTLAEVLQRELANVKRRLRQHEEFQTELTSSKRKAVLSVCASRSRERSNRQAHL